MKFVRLSDWARKIDDYPTLVNYTFQRATEGLACRVLDNQFDCGIFRIFICSFRCLAAIAYAYRLRTYVLR